MIPMLLFIRLPLTAGITPQMPTFASRIEHPVARCPAGAADPVVDDYGAEVGFGAEESDAVEG